MCAAARCGPPELVHVTGRYALAEEELARRCGAARDSLTRAGAGTLAVELDALGRRAQRRWQRLIDIGGCVAAGESTFPEATSPAAHGDRHRDGERGRGVDPLVPERLGPVAAAARASVAGVDVFALCRAAVSAVAMAGAGPLNSVMERARGEIEEDLARLVRVVCDALSWKASGGAARTMCGTSPRDA